MISSLFAPAKVNLFLHVGGPGADGFHPLCSLMVFADVGDRIGIEAADRFGLRVDGPFAADLTSGPDNLVWRAASALFRRAGMDAPALRLVLTKTLPLAAGLGGGSSDAGAALRLLRDHLRLDLDDAALTVVAAELGADGAACLFGRPVVAEGRGEQLSPAPRLPRLDAVLINPGVASSTPAVYRAYDNAGGPQIADHPAMPTGLDDASAVATYLAGLRNDLEAPAIALAPEIGQVMRLLAAQPETLLARVSGSGATCFGLCASSEVAGSLAERLSGLHPTWWVQPCQLGGPWA